MAKPWSSHDHPRPYRREISGSDVHLSERKRREEKTGGRPTATFPRARQRTSAPARKPAKYDVNGAQTKFAGKKLAEDDDSEDNVTLVVQLLQQLEEKFRERKEDDPQDVFNDWCAAHATSEFPGIGLKAIAVPPNILSVSAVKVLETSETNSAPFFTVQGQESDQKGRQAMTKVFAAFCLLNESFEREGRPAMFIMANVHTDNVLGWLKRGHRREKTLEERFPHVFKCESYTCLPGGRHVDHIIVVHKDRILLVQVKAVGSTESSRRPDVVEKSVQSAVKQLQEGRALFHSLMGRSGDGQDEHVLLVVATPMLSPEHSAGLPQDQVHLLCRDHLFEDNITVGAGERDISKFRAWWDELPAATQNFEAKHMEEIVGKYVGLLSTPVVIKKGNEHHLYRHRQQTITMTSGLFRRQILSEKQVRGLEEFDSEKFVYLSGPEASGKTQVILRKAHLFAAADPANRVIVVTITCGSAASCIDSLVLRSLQHAIPRQVSALCLDTSQVKRDDDLRSKIKGVTSEGARSVLFLVVNLPPKSVCEPMLKLLRSVYPECRVWCAGALSDKPDSFREFPMETVLRCPPSVQHLLYHVDWKAERKASYVTEATHLETPTTGPAPLCIRHESHSPPCEIIDCARCANEIVAILQDLKLEQLHPAPKSTPEHHSTSHGSETWNYSGTTHLSEFEVPAVIQVNLPRDLYRKEGKMVYVESQTYHKYMDRVRRSLFLQTLRQKGLKAEVKVKLSCNDFDEVRDRGTLLTTWVHDFVGLESGVVIYLPGDEAAGSKSEVKVDRPDVKREIPVPGVFKDTSAPPSGSDEDATADEGRGQRAQDECASASDEEKTGGGTPKEEPMIMSMRYWKRSDLERFSEWDKTGILLAGTTSLAQLILLVP